MYLWQYTLFCEKMDLFWKKLAVALRLHNLVSTPPRSVSFFHQKILQTDCATYLWSLDLSNDPRLLENGLSADNEQFCISMGSLLNSLTFIHLYSGLLMFIRYRATSSPLSTL